MLVALVRYLLFSILLIFSVYASEIKIYLKEIVYLPKTEVSLGDIAEIKTKNENLKKYLSSIQIKNVYSKGIIRTQDIKKALKENFINLNQTKIYGEKTIVVVKKTNINQQFLKDYIQKYLKKHYPNIAVETINIRNVSIDIVGNPEIIIKEKGKTSSYIYLSVIFPNLNREISASVKYSKIIKAVVANYPLYKGHIIKPEDIRLANIKSTRNRSFIDDIDLLIGKRLKRNIKKDEPISFRDLEKEYFVRKNSNVKVVYQKGTFKIELLGRALENGEKGQIIKVKNLSSGKVIQCKVIGINKVKFLSVEY